MGIKDINATLKECVPQAFMEIPISKFKGKAIGIDTSLWMFKTKSSAMKDVLRATKDPLIALNETLIIESMIRQFYGFMYKLCGAGITPIWIFDGPTHPAKIATDKRKKAKSVKKLTIQDQREKLLAMDPLQRAEEMEKFVKGLLGCISFSRNEEAAIKNEIIALGVPYFVAPHDGEIFAAALSRKQLLLGVWTTDTDTYASGSMITITGFSKGSSSEGIQADVVLMSIVLDQLKITQDQFRDFCILHECDFNQRIPKMGPVGIRKKMDLYKWDLDLFMDTEKDLSWDLLNVEECRSIFNGPNVDHINIKDLYIDRSKWNQCMSGKSFQMDIPPNPTIVEVL